MTDETRDDVDPADLDVERLRQIVDRHVAEHPSPALSWGVVSHGRVVADGGHGLPAGPDTVFRIASMTKSFSAAATLLLRDEGVLRLDDPIDAHAPELAALRGPTSDAAAITVGDLLGMTSGLVTDDAWADRHLDLTDDAFDDIVRVGAVFARPTGTGYEYSNLGYAVLGRVVERAAGARIQDLVTDRLLRPLGMTDTTWVEPDHDRWVGPVRADDGEFRDELPTPGDGLVAPMGGLWTTVTDLARWIAFLDDAVPARDGADDGPLRRSSRRELQAGRRPAGSPRIRGVRVDSSYGYGLREIEDPRLGRVISHSGGLPGYGSNMSWLSGRRVGVVALANVTYAPMAPLAFRLLDDLVEQGVAPRQTPSAHPDLLDAARRLVDLLSDWDDALAVELFSDNVEPDEPFDRRRAAVADLAPLELIGVRAVNDARADVQVTDRHGEPHTVEMSLAPFRPTRIQDYEITGPTED